MTFLEKEQNLIKRLQETDYALFDNNKDECLTTIGNSLESFPNYANIVIKEQVMLPIWQFRLEGQEYRDKISGIDKDRKMAHDSAISNLSLLNNISDKLGLEPFAEVDTKDRYAVADFIGQYVNELYNKGIGKTFDDAVYQRRVEYDKTAPSDRLKKLDQRLGHILENENKKQEQQLETC